MKKKFKTNEPIKISKRTIRQIRKQQLKIVREQHLKIVAEVKKLQMESACRFSI